MKTCSVSECVAVAHSLGFCELHYYRQYRTGTTDLTGRRIDGSLMSRFLARYSVQPNGCWLWNTKHRTRGYARFRVGNQMMLAHRWSYEQFVGPIPDGMTIDHSCHTRAGLACRGGVSCVHRSCVNPEHLVPMDRVQNAAQSPNSHGNRTHCPAGHPYDEANTIIGKRSDGGLSRRCRICRTEYMREFRAKRKG